MLEHCRCFYVDFSGFFQSCTGLTSIHLKSLCMCPGAEAKHLQNLSHLEQLTLWQSNDFNSVDEVTLQKLDNLKHLDVSQIQVNHIFLFSMSPS